MRPLKVLSRAGHDMQILSNDRMTEGPIAVSHTVQLRLSAYPEVQVGGVALQLALKRGLALLAVLSELRRRVARSQLGELLWPDVSRDVARTRLRRLVHNTNQALGFDAIAGDVDTLWIGGLSVNSDVEQTRRIARRLLSEADPALTKEDFALLLLPDAHQILEGFEFGSDCFDEWVSQRRSEQHRLVARALQKACDFLLRRGVLDMAVEAAQRLTALDPLGDVAQAFLLRAHTCRGDIAALDSAYLAYAELLRHELGVRPSPGYEALYEELQKCVAQNNQVLGEEMNPSAPPALVAPIRYADAEDGAVAYLEVGNGPETLIVLFGIWSHLELAWENSTIRAILLELSRSRRVVVLDRRGVGLSERLSPDLSVQAGAADIEAVRRAIGADRICLFGNSVGGMIAIKYAATYPDKVAGLVLYAANARGSWSEDYPWSPTEAQLQTWAEKLHSNWGQATNLEDVAPSQINEPAAHNWWARMIRQAVSRNSLPTLVREFARMDVRALLPKLVGPVLILQREGDRIVRLGTAHYLSKNIPHARLCVLPGNDHHLWAGDAQAVMAEIERFLLEVH